MEFGRLLFRQSPRRRVGRTKEQAENQSGLRGKRRLIELPQRGSEFHDIIGGLARKSIAANAFFSCV
jgi:hypothetical protein